MLALEPQWRPDGLVIGSLTHYKLCNVFSGGLVLDIATRVGAHIDILILKEIVRTCVNWVSL